MFRDFLKITKKSYPLDKSIIVKSKRLDKKYDPVPVSKIFKRFINRRLEKISPDQTRVISRLFKPKNENQVKNIINRIMSLEESKANSILTQILAEFSRRHRNIEEILITNFNEIAKYIPDRVSLSKQRKLLIGSYFTMEYSIESVALFNPSIVIYPKQNNLKKGETRVIFSFRATGEGHISSIVFRSAVIDKNNGILLEHVNRYVDTPKMILNPVYDKALFERKLKDMGFSNDVTGAIFSRLKDNFSFNELQDIIHKIKKENTLTQTEETIDRIIWLAKCNYEVEFPPEHLISERVLFPGSPNESNGLEDARFVRFMDDDGKITYYATYTAYNGLDILPQLIETKDFHHFKMSTLNGTMARNKGMALFPKKIDSNYAMVSRIDGENLYLMYSDNIHSWDEAVKMKQPENPWEFIQIGNCGSPIETEKGWILLTHGVGPMRKYCIAAMLLDLKDPSKVIGRLNEPLITPSEEDREGYVPNVVYSCGSIILNNDLIIPYASSDSVSHIAIISVDELLNKMGTV
jgi:predicted GH43/DUF377 family glycosyl hydrolase